MSRTAPLLPLAETAAGCDGLGTCAYAFGQGVLVDLTAHGHRDQAQLGAEADPEDAPCPAAYR
ncbi:hypothetical protein G6O69_06120 [Pseudenhygromyxa sp. WMMC2535]|uniref:hypothetical protein n=1 Tax=Pseudenhygromyxa sp. WMMC2535 TaxID=2712867 RepID=UPI00155590EF|nr:hypothetical protein [Pseudenhygromyxa sp. WMMC2535]NVB37400.1 hypothetical protein [Pseudenhygromyxa sp. WMMC2535]